MTIVRASTDAAGHIACDSLSQSEIVVPIVVPRASLSQVSREAIQGKGEPELVRAWGGRGDSDEVIIGVLDIDCESQNGFDQDDVQGLERIVRRISAACDWAV